MDFPYLLSVRLMVFNHETYIRDAVEGILKQKTTFPIEVVVGDDFSTDKSLEIIKEYQSTSTIHFKILERKVGDTYWQNRQKLGRLHNFYNILENCSGKYIALLDGDDYWTDPLKLQKQVDFLENNPDFAIYFHNMKIENESTPSINELTNSKEQQSVSTIIDLAAKGNFIFTASVVFRKPIAEYPEWLTHLPIGDYPIHLFNAQFGKIKYLNRVMGVYRVHKSGTWGDIDKEIKYERWIPTLSELAKRFSPEINIQLVYQKKNALFDLYLICNKQGKIDKAKESITQLVECDINYISRKILKTEQMLHKTLNSKAYRLVTKLLRIFSKPKSIIKLKND
jgi:glycosyltransferase involved in cell wall biosynthesis